MPPATGGGAFASQVEAETGTDETKYMNPKRTAQAIAAQAGVGGGVTVVSSLPSADATTVGKLYLLDKGGASSDRLYVGIQSAGSVYRFARMQYDLFTSGGSYDANTIANLLIWMKADALLLSNGDTVGTWTDSSDNANDATEGTEANKPTFVTGVINGLPVVRFDGVNDILSFGTSIDIITPGEGTCFIVAQFTGSTSDDAPALSFNGLNLYGNTSSTPGNWAMYLDGTVDTGAANDVFCVLGFQMRAANDIDVQINDGAVNNISGSGFYPRSFSRIGTEDSGSQRFTGDIAEILVWDRVLTTEEYSDTLSYLMSKYGFS